MDAHNRSVDDVELGAARKHAGKLLAHYGLDDETLLEVVSLYTAANRSGINSSDALEIATGLVSVGSPPARVDNVSLDGLLEHAAERHEPVGSLVSGVYECLRTRKEEPPRTAIGGRVYQRSAPLEQRVSLIGVDEQKRVVEEELGRLFMYNPFEGTNSENGAREAGVLFYGPPGTGKSSLCKHAIQYAKMLSERTKLPFAHETITSRDHSKWVGETAKIVHQKFMRISDPSGVGLLILDDMDMVFPKRSEQDNTAGLHMTSQFMQEMDGVDARGYHNRLVLATTNRPQHVDEAIIDRRITKKMLVPPYETLEQHAQFMDEQMPWADESIRELVAAYTFEQELVASRMSDVVKHVNKYRCGPVSLEVLSLPLEQRAAARKKELRELSAPVVEQLLASYSL